MSLYIKRFLLLVAFLSMSCCTNLDSSAGKMMRQIQFEITDKYRVSINVVDGPIGVHIDQGIPITRVPDRGLVIFDAFYDRKTDWGNRDLHNSHLSGTLFRISGHSKNKPLVISDLPSELFHYPVDEHMASRLADLKVVMLGDREWLRMNLVGEDIHEENRIVIRDPGAQYATIIGVDYALVIGVLVDEEFAANTAKFEARKEMLEAVAREVRITRIE